MCFLGVGNPQIGMIPEKLVRYFCFKTKLKFSLIVVIINSYRFSLVGLIFGLLDQRPAVMYTGL